MENVLEKLVAKIKSNVRLLFFRKFYRLWNNVDKYCRAELTTDDKMAHAGYVRLQTDTHNF